MCSTAGPGWGRTVTAWPTALAVHWLQDDAHIFCLPSQIESEILGVLDLTQQLLSQFGFQDFEVSGVACVSRRRVRAGCVMANQNSISVSAPPHDAFAARSTCLPDLRSLLGQRPYGIRLNRRSRRHCSARSGTWPYPVTCCLGCGTVACLQGMGAGACLPHTLCVSESCWPRAGHLPKMWAAGLSTGQKLTSKSAMLWAGSGSALQCRCGPEIDDWAQHFLVLSPLHSCKVQIMFDVHAMSCSLCLLLQLDFNLPDRFDMFYIRWLGCGEGGQRGCKAFLPDRLAPCSKQVASH